MREAESCPWKMPLDKDARSWKEWFVPLFKFISDKNVKAFSYINCDWDKIPMFQSMGWGDTQIQSNSEIQKKWTQEISKDKYIKSTPSLFKLLGYHNGHK